MNKDVKYKLELYITGNSRHSVEAVKNLDEICKIKGEKNCEAHIINVLEDPSVIAEEGIIATPTLIRKSPLPVRKLIGDLSDRENVLRFLE